MVITNAPTTPTTTSPDSDNDTPTHSQPIRQFPFSNGTANHHRPRRQHHHPQPPPPPPPYAAVTYRECLKNHAANLGGHALDGCGEFMPSATATRNDPASLTCAACGCHRNFHRRELPAPEENTPPHFEPAMTPHFIDFRKPRRPSLSPSPPPPPAPQQSSHLSFPAAPQMLLALSTAAQEDQKVPSNQHFTVATPSTPRDAKSVEHNLSGRKRFRTKFTPQQKEKMHLFAESLGWKMQRCNQTAVENFCKEIGVAKGVLKVWMHNNKNTIGGKREGGSRQSRRNAVAAVTNDMNENINSSGMNNAGIIPRGSIGYNMNHSLNDDGEEEEDDDDDDNNESGDHNMGNGGIRSSPSRSY